MTREKKRAPLLTFRVVPFITLLYFIGVRKSARRLWFSRVVIFNLRLSLSLFVDTGSADKLEGFELYSLDQGVGTLPIFINCTTSNFTLPFSH